MTMGTDPETLIDQTKDKRTERSSLSGASVIRDNASTMHNDRLEWTLVNSKQNAVNRKRSRDERKLRQMISLDESTPKEQTYLKYFIVKFLGADINNAVNIIQTDKELKAKIGAIR